MSSIIATLKNFLRTKTVYPVTLTTAVYTPEDHIGLDAILNDSIRVDEDSTVTTPIPIDANRLVDEEGNVFIAQNGTEVIQHLEQLNEYAFDYEHQFVFSSGSPYMPIRIKKGKNGILRALNPLGTYAIEDLEINMLKLNESVAYFDLSNYMSSINNRGCILSISWE